MGHIDCFVYAELSITPTPEIEVSSQKVLSVTSI
jgi:hypothetical protein